MFCYKCGSEIPEESEFCMKCGAKMPINNLETSEPPEKNPVNETPEKKQTFMQKLLFGNSGATSLSEFNEKVKNGDYVIPMKEPKQAKEKPLSKRQRIKENKKNAIACCPKCGSTSITANKKGFGIGKAVVGSAIVGPIGLVAGNKGAKKVRITCLNCGHQWKP